MKCPECGFENVDKAKFCVECGTRMEVQCANCKTRNPAGNKFCFECGQSLAAAAPSKSSDLSFDEKISKIQKYLPEGLTEKILSQRERIEGEKKQVTVLFCDMEGFTPLSEKLGPEGIYALMDEVYEILIHKVNDYGGTVNELTGDGIMALFGAPIALEDAPQRAIRSALAIQSEITRFGERMSQEKKIPPIRMRAGIHSGPVVVGTVGNNLRVEFKALGDTVNLASRMESLAEPGAIYVTEDTFRLAEGLFRFENMGKREIKGKDAPVRIYKVLAPSSRRTRFEVSAERGLTPFVGRERELDTLMDVFQRAKRGYGQALSIVSDAGVGKSRLLYEFKKAVLDGQPTLLEGRCLSYGKNIAYHPILDMLKTSFNIREEDDDTRKREKLVMGLRSLGETEDSSLTYLLELLSVKDSGLDQVMLSPEGKKERIIEVLNRIVVKTSETGPVIIAVEDLQWVDRSSQDVLDFVLENIPGLPIMLAFTYRPGYTHGWGTKSYHSQITLNRLSSHETSEMTTHLLGTVIIDKDVETLVLEKTEGNPLFVEEFVRVLLDLEIVKKDPAKYRMSLNKGSVAIPSTIHDMVMSRVDTLPEGAKDLLQTASAIEREFSFPLILNVSGLGEKQLLESLTVLKNSELIYEKGIHPDTKYFFKHALTREVIYDSLLERKKKELHNRIGNAIEKAFEPNLAGHHGALANHFMKSENFIKAARYAKLAAKRNQRAGSLPDAIMYGQNYVTALESLPRTPELDRSIIDARTTLGLYYNQTNDFVQSKEAISPITSRATDLDYRRRLAQIYTILGAYSYVVEEDFPKALGQLEQAIKFATETGDMISVVMANHWTGHILSDDCQFEKALHHIQIGLKINEMANILWGISAHKSCIARTIYVFKGEIAVANAMIKESIALAEESGDAYSKAEAYISHGCCCYHRNLLEEAESNLIYGNQFCQRSGFISMSLIAHAYLHMIYFHRGDYANAKLQFSEMMKTYEIHKQYPSYGRLHEVVQLGLEVMNKDSQVDLSKIQSYAGMNKVKRGDGMLRRHIGEVLLHSKADYLEKAADWIHGAIEADTKNGLAFELGMDLASFSNVFRKRGDILNAKEMLGKAIKILQECGADGWVEKYEKELSVLQ
jgi:class 3 adenylate cyclase/tetratricopeptide (TPR) repeat protein